MKVNKSILLLLFCFGLTSVGFTQSGKVLVLVEDGFNADEYWRPLYILSGAGLELEVASSDKGVVQAGHKNRLLDIEAATDLQSVDVLDYHALFIPGGHSPAKLVNNPAAIAIVKRFSPGKPIAAICHGPWILISAGITKGRKMTGFWSIEADIINSGESLARMHS